MRGKGQWLHKTFRCSRITPAHAGKSRLAGKVLPARRDHPRARGEKAGCLWLGRVREGSPPHARGKAVPRAGEAVRMRITPARAGKSAPVFPVGHNRGDHPRTRGEKLPGGWRCLHPLGSPPHARGKGIQAHQGQTPQGITPARAGKRDMPCL